MLKSEFISQSSAAASLFEAIASHATSPGYRARLLAVAKKVRFKASLAEWGVPVALLDAFPKRKPYDRKLLAQLRPLLLSYKSGVTSDAEIKTRLLELIGIQPGGDVDRELLDYFDIELRAYLRGETPLKIAANGLASVVESERDDRAVATRFHQEARLQTRSQIVTFPK